jgi:hypothetical protein
MDKQALIAWIQEQRYVGKRFKEDEETQVARLDKSLDRFRAYLHEERGIERIEDTTLDALKAFDFNDAENDDEHLRLVFSYLDRRDLAAYMGMVSADKYFRNQKLTSVFSALDDLKGHVKRLRAVDIRMGHQLLERGATPEGRAEIAEATGVPADHLLTMVHGCDLSRMTGMAGKTLMHSLAMGYDILAKFRAVTEAQIEADFSAYLQETGQRTNRMVSFSSFVRQANQLEDGVVC